MAWAARLQRGALVAIAFGVGGWSVGCHLFGGLSDLEFRDEGGQGGGTPAACIPSSAGGTVDTNCGLFVSSSGGNDDDGDGSQARPYATITRALTQPGSAPIYLCAESFAEAVALPSDRDLFGALDCQAGWAYTPNSPSVIDGPADAVALSVSGGGDNLIADLRIVAGDGSAETGNSSIAVLVDGGSVRFERCSLLGGRGGSGATGATPEDALPMVMDGAAGQVGCGPTPNIETPGGQGLLLTCDDGTQTRGGDGADGVQSIGDGDSGQNGSTNPPHMTPNANGGEGETSINSGCGPGTEGSAGATGEQGLGAPATDVGTVDASGYHGPSGSAGISRGGPGQGGGGGGGLMACDGGGGLTGSASGGSGGSGGCGGAPGLGGGAGGASFALLSVGAQVELHDCNLVAGAGGEGGEGGRGQLGSDGGRGGDAAAYPNACAGGIGGNGGRGGGGGGGRGGHSIAIAYTGDAPAQQDTTVTPGEAGLGGDGAVTSMDQGKGAAGLAAGQRAF